MNEIKIDVKDAKVKFKISNWSIERFFKRMMVNIDSINGSIKDNGKYRIVDPAHAMMLENVCLNTDVYKFTNVDVKYPSLDVKDKMELCGVNTDIIFLTPPDGSFINKYSFDYFISIIQTFGKPEEMVSGKDYPLILKYKNGFEILLVPRIGDDEEIDMYIFNFKAWIPNLYGNKPMSAPQKISYLYSLDQDITLGDAIEMMENKTDDKFNRSKNNISKYV